MPKRRNASSSSSSSSKASLASTCLPPPYPLLLHALAGGGAATTRAQRDWTEARTPGRSAGAPPIRAGTAAGAAEAAADAAVSKSVLANNPINHQSTRYQVIPNELPEVWQLILKSIVFGLDFINSN